MTEAERKQAALLKQKQQLYTRDDKAEQLQREMRTAQVERISEMFRKCDKDGSNKLDSGAELRCAKIIACAALC
mgnify:CR=1 FL=1